MCESMKPIMEKSLRQRLGAALILVSSFRLVVLSNSKTASSRPLSLLSCIGCHGQLKEDEAICMVNLTRNPPTIAG